MSKKDKNPIHTDQLSKEEVLLFSKSPIIRQITLDKIQADHRKTFTKGTPRDCPHCNSAMVAIAGGWECRSRGHLYTESLLTPHPKKQIA